MSVVETEMVVASFTQAEPKYWHKHYSATREDDTTFIFSHFGLFLSDAASNSHK